MKTLYLVGMGPGSYEDMTLRAIRTLEKSDVILGYTVYVDLLREHFPDKTFLTTPMKKEEERCRMAFRMADAGHVTSLVCSGDAGVYGMAGLIWHMASDYKAVQVIVVPGVTAALSGAALLGAPLIHDFAVISLSDLLTPRETIRKRLRAAAESDMVIVLYNPGSRKRRDYLKNACDLIMETRSGETACGLVRQIGRAGEEKKVMTLKALRETEVDMFTTCFIGNAKTKIVREHLVTPRGYRCE